MSEPRIEGTRRSALRAAMGEAGVERGRELADTVFDRLLKLGFTVWPIGFDTQIVPPSASPGKEGER
jgi:hypothetical protein